MEITFSVGRYWKNCGRPYQPLTNHDIIKNVLIESEHSKERHNLMIDLLAQMEERLPPFSTLYINLNPKVECPGMFVAKFTYGSLNLNIPYIHDLRDDSRDRFSRCFNAIFNFHHELQIVMEIVYSNCTQRGFPTSIIGFLELMHTYLKDKPYDKEFTESLLKNINEAIDLFESDNVLEKTFRASTSLPDWVTLWREKQNVWIDLSGCKPLIQKMLIPVIFLNLLRSTNHYGPSENYWHLNGVVIINEADKIFASVPWERYKARYNQRKQYWEHLKYLNLFLTKEQMVEAYGEPAIFFKSQLETYYNDLLRNEFRFRNIMLFTGTRDEKKVQDFISGYSQVRIIQNENQRLFIKKNSTRDF